MNEPIFSNLTSKGCTGDCASTWYWYDENLGEGAWPGAYGWYGNNVCNPAQNCYIPPENPWDQTIYCTGGGDPPSFSGTYNGQVAYTYCTHN